MSGRAVGASEEPSRSRKRRASVGRDLVQTVKECLQAGPVEKQHVATERAKTLETLVRTAKEVQSRGTGSRGLRLLQRMPEAAIIRPSARDEHGGRRQRQRE